jgi:MFS family permease
MATSMIFLINITLSFCSVVGEAIVVELSKLETHDKDSKAKDYVSLYFLSRTIGELLSSYLKGIFVDIMPLRYIFIIACFVPIILIIAGFTLVEYPQTMEESDMEAHPLIQSKSKFREFSDFMLQKYILIPISFIILFKATPNYHDPFFYFLTNELKFSASALGKISFCSTIAILFAIIIYKAYLKECNFKFMIVLGTIISFIVSLLCYTLVLRINIQYGISDFWLLLFTNSFLSMVGEFVLLPILSLACVLCPKNLEGTIYSVFMSTLNLGGIFSNLSGSYFTNILDITSNNYSNLHILILLSKIFSLLPLPILFCINNKYFHPELNEEKINNKEKLDEEEKKLLNS